MTQAHIPDSLREYVRRRAGQRCEYCQTAEWISGLECEIDHVVPRAANGLTDADNLCLACSACNGYKLAKTHGIDRETGQTTPLFNPRQQAWRDHFAWSDDGAHLIGLTPCGRATIDALQMNNPLITAARAIWARAGHHPPHAITPSPHSS